MKTPFYRCHACDTETEESELDTRSDTVSMPYGDRESGVSAHYLACPKCGCVELEFVEPEDDPEVDEDEPDNGELFDLAVTLMRSQGMGAP